MITRAEFEKCMEDEIEKVKEITLNGVQTLHDLLVDIYELDICSYNIRKFAERTKAFYDEVIEEARKEQKIILEKIRDYHVESATLQHILQIEIKLKVPKDEPLYTIQSNLNEQLKPFRKIRQQRKLEIVDLQNEQKILCEELNETPYKINYEPLPTENEIFEFRLYVEYLRAEKNNRLKLIENYRNDIKVFMKDLERPIQSEEEQYLLNDRSLPLSQHSITTLQNLRTKFVNQMEDTQEAVNHIKEKVENLWNAISASPEIRKKFASYSKYLKSTYNKYKLELIRCEEIKNLNIKLSIDKCRNEIIKFWDLTLKSDVERSKFTDFSNDCYNDELLASHEKELRRLKKFYNENDKLFTLIQDQTSLWIRMQELSNEKNDPSRYYNRGGVLLKEERERNLISFKLPKIEKQIKELADEYEITKKHKFTIYGQDILELIPTQLDIHKRYQRENNLKSTSDLSPSFNQHFFISKIMKYSIPQLPSRISATSNNNIKSLSTKSLNSMLSENKLKTPKQHTSRVSIGECSKIHNDSLWATHRSESVHNKAANCKSFTKKDINKSDVKNNRSKPKIVMKANSITKLNENSACLIDTNHKLSSKCTVIERKIEKKISK